MGDTDDRLILTLTDLSLESSRIVLGTVGAEGKRGNKPNYSCSELERSKITWRSLVPPPGTSD